MRFASGQPNKDQRADLLETHGWDDLASGVITHSGER